MLALFELWLFPLPLCFIFLFLWQLLYSKEEAMVLAFFAGFVFDLLLLRTLGTTSILFITLLFLIFLYKRKFQTDNVLFVVASTFVSFLILEFTYRGVIDVAAALFYTVITLILVRLLFKPKTAYESWYRVS